MKNNFVAKHMKTFNKSNIHIDRKKQGLDKTDEIEEGLRLYEKVNLNKEELNQIGLNTLNSYVNSSTTDKEFTEL